MAVDDGGSPTVRRGGGPGTGEEGRDPPDLVMWGSLELPGRRRDNPAGESERERKLMREREQRGIVRNGGANDLGQQQMAGKKDEESVGSPDPRWSPAATPASRREGSDGVVGVEGLLPSIQSRAREQRVRARDRTGLGGAGWLGGWIGKAGGFGFADRKSVV